MARIAGINIPQNKLVHVGLTYIYGIGDKFSQQICNSLKIPREKRVNQLTDDEILIPEIGAINFEIICAFYIRRSSKVNVLNCYKIVNFRGYLFNF